MGYKQLNELNLTVLNLTVKSVQPFITVLYCVIKESLTNYKTVMDASKH